MSRYIDADAVINNLPDDLPYKASVKRVLMQAPTADVVEVVRCRDCIYYNSNCCFNRQWDHESSEEVPMVRETDYCSYGERRATDGDG